MAARPELGEGGVGGGLADAVLLAAADAVANRTLELMGESKPIAAVLDLPKRVSVA